MLFVVVITPSPGRVNLQRRRAQHRGRTRAAVPIYCGRDGTLSSCAGTYEGHETPLGQLHNSLNGGSVGHGGTELRLAPPPDADTLVPDALLDVDTPVDDRPDP
jgi:hypothetical protein